jgi:imidazoleglycerol-phosphate dehydratase
MSRAAERSRETGETKVKVRLDVDGSGIVVAQTGVGFFDHLLDLLGRHALLDLDVQATGDLETGSHHTVEDVGITLGLALDEALGDRAGIERYGWAVVPMDECLVRAALDLSGRAYMRADVPLPATVIGGFETDLLDEFLRAVAFNSRMTLHVSAIETGNPHHLIEASIKALARAVRMAVSPSVREQGVPSTKGTL